MITGKKRKQLSKLKKKFKVLLFFGYCLEFLNHENCKNILKLLTKDYSSWIFFYLQPIKYKRIKLIIKALEKHKNLIIV